MDSDADISPAGSVESNTDSDGDSSPEPPRPCTRLQGGIRKPRQYTDGTIRYGMFSSIGELENLAEALGDEIWRQAMNEEHTSLMQNKTRHLVPANSTKNLIDCKWVYRVKKHADGTVERYKARLVSKGFK
jgi:hypothetical protein